MPDNNDKTSCFYNMPDCWCKTSFSQQPDWYLIEVISLVIWKKFAYIEYYFKQQTGASADSWSVLSFKLAALSLGSWTGGVHTNDLFFIDKSDCLTNNKKCKSQCAASALLFVSARQNPSILVPKVLKDKGSYLSLWMLNDFIWIRSTIWISALRWNIVVVFSLSNKSIKAT